MPELPPPKRQSVIEAGSGQKTAGLSTIAHVAYAELHCRTNFSFLEGASHPDELVQTAAQLGYRALAITDRNSLAGVVRAHAAARSAGLKLLIGAEVTPVDAPPIVLLAADRAAYGRLCRLLTRGRRSAPKGECALTFDDIVEHAEGLLACVVLKHVLGRPVVPGLPVLAALRVRPGGERQALTAGLLDGGRPAVRSTAGSGDPRRTSGNPRRTKMADALHKYREAFGDRCYALAELHHGPDDRLLLAQMQNIAKQHRLPLAAAND